MATKSFKKKSIVAGSPAIQEHEAMMEQVMTDSPAVDVVPVSPQPPSVPQQAVGVFSQHQYEPLKNVQTRVPLSTYEKLNRLKYFAGQRTSIGDIVATAIQEYVDRHPC